MTTPDSSYEGVRSKAAELIRNKLFHPSKENDEIVRLSEEFADLWPTEPQSYRILAWTGIGPTALFRHQRRP